MASSANVSDAPLSGTGVTVHPTEGAAFSGSVATFTDADPAGASGDYSATIDWGDSHTSTVTVSGSDGVFTVAGMNTYVEEGTFAITVTITDEGGASITVASSAIVSDAPLSGSNVTVHSTEGSAFSGTVATFTDANPTSAAGEYSATINWGDGHTSTVTASGSNGVFTVAGTNTYAEEGTFAVTVTINDEGGASTAVASSAIVSDAPLSGAATTVQPVQGTAFSGALATFTDADPAATASDYTATISWGDGQTSTAAVSGPSGGVFTVMGTHTYAAIGTLSIIVTVKDAGGALVSLPGVSHVYGTPSGSTDVYLVNLSGSSSAASSQGALINDTDPNANPHLSASLVSGPSNGTLTFNADGSFTYTPGAAFKGVDSFVYRPYDGPAYGANVTVTLYSHNGALVQKLFEQMLNRAAMSSDIGYWAPAMDSGSQSVSSIVQALYSSNEYLAPKINAIYEAYLGFTDPNAVSYWEGIWNSSHGPEQVIIQIAALNGCYTHAGGTNAAWVTLMYNNIFSRAPSSTELNYWVAELNNGISRTQVVQSFVGSAEYRADVIQSFFEQFLNRAASSTDVNYYESHWVSQLALQQDIVLSSEYTNNPPAAGSGSVYKWQ